MNDNPALKALRTAVSQGKPIDWDFIAPPLQLQRITPMSNTVKVTVFSFDELSERAKENARDWWRKGALDYGWWDAVYEYASNVAEILGIDLEQKTVKLMSGRTCYDPAIYFSGFCSQGDGACFDATYRYAKGAAKKIREYAPQDAEIHAIADALQATQRKAFYRLEANIRQSGRYFDVEIEVFDREDNYKDIGNAENDIAKSLRDFAHWIYQKLENEHDYLMGDEQVDEAIRSNKYIFDEHGNEA